MEFGAFLRVLREEKGMTQQSLADRLYVTRQAVSRWECGARYPDVLTTKKLAEIFEVSIDELVSGEELKKDVDAQPVLDKPVTNFIQTALYAAGFTAYFMKSVFAIQSFYPDPALSHTPAGQIGVVDIISAVVIWINCIALAAGLYYSLKNKLSPVKIAVIMSTFFWLELLRIIITWINMNLTGTGYMGIGGVIEVFYYSAVVCAILWYFLKGGQYLRFVIYLSAVFQTYRIARMVQMGMMYYTDLGFVTRTVSCIGLAVWVILSVYQTVALQKKRMRGVVIK